MPTDGRETAGWMFSRGRDHGLDPHGDHVGIGGTADDPGKLIFLHGDDKASQARRRPHRDPSAGPGTTSFSSATATRSGCT